MEIFTHEGQELKFVMLGDPASERVFIWTHGWGQDHRAFLQTAKTLEGMGAHVLVDFPGFGTSPAPSEVWGPEDYAAFMATFVKSLNARDVIWVGHSFGCRVGIWLAARYPDLLSRMVLVAAAGLKRKRSPFAAAYFQFRIALYKVLKRLTALGLSDSWLKSKFGSSDYKRAGVMRDVLVKTVNEDLTDIAGSIQCPTLLVFGQGDDQTPPEMGMRYERLINNSKLVLLDGYDHYTILSEGHHQLTRLIKEDLS